ncbi:MAG: TrkH family potassium uptake protein [Planctomycetaceae bacterium]|nr:TrkH family potassium uptake protein [Planctomycetaceae bacterium]
MNWSIVARMLGLLGLLIGGSMAFSLPWAFPICGQVENFESRGFWGMVQSIGCCCFLGGTLFLWGGKPKGAILRKEALAVVGLGWILAGLLGALPFVLSGTEIRVGQRMTPVEAIFESISGFTTTGASVITELEDPQTLSRCVLFWRCFTHWLGGMGIIVLFVAILGQLGAGGKAMLKREVPGPITESVRPRVRETAMTMWAIYVLLSAIECVLLMAFELSPFDALCHTFGTMATGGFSTFNRSAGHFNGGPVEAIIILFMILAGTNFSLFYAMCRRHVGDAGLRGRIRILLTDPEFRAYIGIILFSTGMITFSLIWHQSYERPAESARHALFSVVSVMTTTGFGTEDFATWPEFCKGLLLLLMFVGGSAGSTGGGIKVIRFVLLFKILMMEVERAYRPNVVRQLKLARAPVDDQVRSDVVVYFCFIGVITALGWLTLITIEPDHQWGRATHLSTAEKLLDCGTAVAATLNNIGPGLGVVGPTQNYASFSQQGKALLTLLMLLGRLELFAVLVLFSRRFWQTQ